MSVFPGFMGGYARSQSPIANVSTLQNWYTQPLTPGSKGPGAFYPTPGMERFGSVSQVGGKRMFSTAAGDSRMFSVHGARLYEWFADGSAIERGTVAVDANPAVIFTNGEGGQQLGVCAGGNFYVMDLQTNVVTQVASMNGQATQIGFISGYFLVFDVNTGTVYQSDLYDGLVFDPLNFFQRSTQADDWVAMFVTSLGRILLLGSKTRDNYENVGTFPIPFAPSAAGLQPEGIAATFSVTEAGAYSCWLGTAGQSGGYKIYGAQGYRAEELSTEPIAFALSQATEAEIANATGEAYSDQNVDFLNIYVGAFCFTFDFKSREWHTRRSFQDAVSGILGPWRARWHCFAFNKHLWADSSSGVVSESDISFPTDFDGLLIPRERTTPSICIENQMLDIGDIELIMQKGVGNPNDPGMNPMIGLEISRDGGMTWGRQRFMPIGRIGQYIRVRFQNNGSGRDIAFRWTASDPINNYRLVTMLIDLRGENGQRIDLARAA